MGDTDRYENEHDVAPQPPTRRYVDGRKSTQIRFDPEVYDRVVKAAESFGMPVNWLVNQLMREALDRLIDPSEFRLTKARSDGA